MGERTYVVAQLGARMHYAVPRILQESGQLERLYTDICAVRGWPRLLNLIPGPLRPAQVNRLLSRVPRGVHPERITAFNDFGYKYAKRQKSGGRHGRFLVHLWAGEEFCRRVLSEGFGNAKGVFTYNTAGLEILQRAKQEGLKAVTEQTIAPMRLELEIMDEEASKHSGWEPPTERAGALAYCDREEEEWKSADLVLCACDFVRDGIARCGGPVEKCIVVPYGVDLPVEVSGVSLRPRVAYGPVGSQQSELGNRSLRVLTVGSIGLRKGAPYVLETAKRLKGDAHFRMVGGIGVERQAEAKLCEHVELVGRVPRDKIEQHFAWADVFLLPSLCEGSATVTYEALAHGVPVICTPNTGSVVRHGLDGFVIPIRDAGAIVNCLRQLLDDPEMLHRMSDSALERAKEFTIAKYGERLLESLNSASWN